MNRPRNRQPRPPRQQGGGDSRARSNPGGQYGNVPTVQQVTPGASVSIVLKADQSTGRETPGIVKDLLTKGNHPRGIKVRLQDGQVGRVQRMITSSLVGPGVNATSHMANSDAPPLRSTETEDYPSLPPARSLADFIPDTDENLSLDEPTQEANIVFSSATIKCPICGVFDGDEAAVSHHVQSHLS